MNSSQPLASYNIGSLSSGTGAGAITMAAAQAVQATAQVRNGKGVEQGVSFYSKYWQILVETTRCGQEVFLIAQVHF